MPILSIGINLNSTKQTQFKTSKMNSVRLNLCSQDTFQSNTIKNSKKISFQGLSAKPNLFKKVAASAENFRLKEKAPGWLKLISREEKLYERPNKYLSEFSRDFNRIIFSEAFKRLSGKTQVFMHPNNSDMITNRMLHSEYVPAIGESISDFIALNSKLVRTTGKAHDLGQPPFGHDGEKALDRLMKEHHIKSDFWQGRFWHEKNGLRIVDDIETLADPEGYHRNLNLTYATRDGIVCHCGEVDENGLIPRTDYIDLRAIQFDKRPQPFTYEGCTTKIADKIGYLSLDIEDALKMKFIHPNKKKELVECIEDLTKYNFKEINNSVLMHHFVSEIHANSNPKSGLKLSEHTFQLMNLVKKTNYKEIYDPIKTHQVPYIDEVITTIFNHLNAQFSGKNTLTKLDKTANKQPELSQTFREWLVKYSDIAPKEREEKKYANKILYNIEDENDYKLSIIEFIAGMTDSFASKTFSEIKAAA